MPLHPVRSQELRQHVHNSDVRAAEAYGQLAPVLRSRFIDAGYAASEIATSIGVNGYEDTLHRLTSEPQHFGHLNDAQDWDVSSVASALHAYNSALETYWQACDELEQAGSARSSEDFNER